MMNDGYTGARVSNAEKVLIENAAVTSGRLGDREVTLNIPGDVPEEMREPLTVTLSGDPAGLITYRAEILDSRRISEEDACGEVMYEVRCKLTERLEIIQRRGNAKVTTSFPITISFCGPDGKPVMNEEKNTPKRGEATVKDVSASGLLFESERDLEIGQRVGFLFDRAPRPFTVNAEIIRSQVSDGVKSYGCRFIGLSAAEESAIRQYLFRIRFSRS